MQYWISNCIKIECESFFTKWPFHTIRQEWKIKSFPMFIFWPSWILTIARSVLIISMWLPLGEWIIHYTATRGCVWYNIIEDNVIIPFPLISKWKRTQISGNRPPSRRIHHTHIAVSTIIPGFAWIMFNPVHIQYINKPSVSSIIL